MKPTRQLMWSLLIVLGGLEATPAHSQVRGAGSDYIAGHADIGLAYDAATGPRFFLQFGGDARAIGLTNEQLVAGQPGGIMGEW